MLSYFIMSVAMALITIGLFAWVLIRVSRGGILWTLLALGGIAYFGAQWVVRIIDGLVPMI